MKGMWRIGILLAAGAAAGCAWTDPDYSLGRSREQLEGSPGGTSGEGSAATSSHLYLTAVAYPEGYDWQRDTACGRVDCRIVVFRDGERFLELPVREGVAADPDLHRLFNGHLYTEDCTDAETIVSRDGDELFRFGGRELLRGFLVAEDGRIHSLGQSRDGPGFRYRIDGIVQYEQASGRLYGGFGSGSFRGGALYRDDGKLCFAFSTAGGRHVLWRDGEENELYLNEPQRVFDIRSVGGQAVAAYATTGEGLRLAVGDADFCPASLQVIEARIIPHGQTFRLAVRYRDREGGMNGALLDESGLEEVFEGLRVEPVPDGEGWVTSDANGHVCAIRWGGGTAYPEAGRWRVMGPGCIWMYGGKAWVGLSGHPPDAPVLWDGGETTTLLLNGFLTGVVYE